MKHNSIAFYQVNSKNYINGFGRNVLNTWHELPATQTRRLRKLVQERDGYKCRVCADKRRLQVDHIIPIKAGGPISDPSNIQLLCEKCFNRKRIQVNELYRTRVVYSPRVLAGKSHKRRL